MPQLSAGLAALLLVICVVAGVTHAVLRALTLWRAAKKTGGEISREVEHVSAVAAQIEGQLQRAAASQERLAAATVKLGASRARLDVQLAAIREAQTAIRRLVWFFPR